MIEQAEGMPAVVRQELLLGASRRGKSKGD